MATEVSKAQIDRLGERLRKGNISDDDLRLLDSYRRSFSEVYEFVAGAIREESDVVNPAIKYGGGNEETQILLTETSSLVAGEESLETALGTVAQLSSIDKQKIVNFQDELNAHKQDIFNHLRNIIEELEELKGASDDISD
jgi:hypothetical protein